MKQGQISFEKTTAKLYEPVQQGLNPNSQKINMITPKEQKQKIMSLTCGCEIERNNFKVQFGGPDKNRVLQIFRLTTPSSQPQMGNLAQTQPQKQTLKFVVITQKTADVVIEFFLSQVAGVYPQSSSKGLLSFTVREPPEGSLPTKNNLGRSQIAATINPAGSSLTKVLLSKLEVTMLEQLCKIIQAEMTSSRPNLPQPSQKQQLHPASASLIESKKRKLNQISNPATLVKQNSERPKVRKLNYVIDGDKEDLTMNCVPRKKININDLPWDILGVILNFVPRLDYRRFRVNKQFTKLINKRKKGLTFRDNQITSVIFFTMLEKSTMIQRLSIQTPLKFVTMTQMKDMMPSLPSLIELDLLNFKQTNAQCLYKLIHSCKYSLRVFKISYENIGIDANPFQALAKCSKLQVLQLGSPQDYIQRQEISRLSHVKRMLLTKTFSLKSLCLYEADSHILSGLFQSEEVRTLDSLQIVKFNQQERKNLKEIECLAKFKSLAAIDLCSTYFPLEFEVQNSAADPSQQQQPDQPINVAGSRELELVLFGNKEKLIELHLGQYLTNDLVIYLAEICKNVERLEINSEKVTDQSVAEVLKKMKNLKYLDLAACPNFTGIAFGEIEEIGSPHLSRVRVGFQGYEMQKIKEKLGQLRPGCEVELKLKKSYKI